MVPVEQDAALRGDQIAQAKGTGVTPKKRRKRRKKAPKVRGQGRIYQRGETWWIQYSHRGKLHRESSKSTDQARAVSLLQLRQGEMAQGRLPGFDAEKVTFGDLEALIEADYVQKGNRTWWRVEDTLQHLRPVFEHLPAARIDYDRVSRYISARLDAGAARGTVHHELAALGRMLKLGVIAGRLQVRPPLPVLKLHNTRTGFFSDDEVYAVLRRLPEWYAAPIEFAWRTGWRIGEVKGLTWAQIDWGAGTVRLEVGSTKNRAGRLLPFAASPALSVLLRDQWERTEAWQREHGQIVPWVFWKAGRRLGDHRDTWMRACREAGLPGRLVHDLRRSAVRNLVRAGVNERVAMSITGHKTRSVFDRYNIVSDGDLTEAMGKLAAFQQRDGSMTSAPNRPGARTSTVPAQIASRAISSEDADDSGTESTATGTHDPSVDYAITRFPAARPATVPDDQHH